MTNLTLHALAAMATLWAVSLAMAQEPVTTPQVPVQTNVQKDLLTTLNDAGNYKTFLRLVRTTDLATLLTSVQPTQPTDPTTPTTPPTTTTYTILAPTDAAFQKLPAGALDALEKQPEMLRKVLQYHILSGSLNSATWTDGQTLTTLANEPLKVTIGSSGTMLGGVATIGKTDTRTSNGNIVSIDTVLVPPSQLKPTTPVSPTK